MTKSSVNKVQESKVPMGGVMKNSYPILIL